jgi:hypothetical protein
MKNFKEKTPNLSYLPASKAHQKPYKNGPNQPLTKNICILFIYEVLNMSLFSSYLSDPIKPLQGGINAIHNTWLG